MCISYGRNSRWSESLLCVRPHFYFSIYLFILVFEYFSELRWLLYLAFRDLIGKEMHWRCKFHKSDGIGPSNGSELGKSSRRKKSFLNFFLCPTSSWQDLYILYLNYYFRLPTGIFRSNLIFHLINKNVFTFYIHLTGPMAWVAGVVISARLVWRNK